MKELHHQKYLIDQEDISPARLQALVDGVFAIAMTLLVFNIHAPALADPANAQDLFLQLASLWPSLVSFIISFIVLGTFWVGHHTEFHYIKKLDHTLIWLNIFYLLSVSFTPFTAELLGRFTQNQTAIMIYGANLIVMVLIHYGMWQHIKNHKNLVVENLDPSINKLVNVLAFFAILAYALAMAVSFWWVPASLIIYFIVPLPYIFGWIYRLI